MPTAPLFQIYTDIAISIAGVTAIKKCDVDLGQMKKGGEDISWDVPGVIIRNENVWWRPYEDGSQLGLVHTRLKIIYPYTSDTEYYGFEIYRTEVETFYDIIRNITAAIDGITNSAHSNFYRFNECHLNTLPAERQWIYCIDYICNIHNDASDIDGMIVFSAPDLATENVIYERTINARFDRGH
jgi:hypothetical protein